MKHNILIFVGMDIHKELPEVAYSLDVRDEHSLHYGKTPITKQALSISVVYAGAFATVFSRCLESASPVQKSGDKRKCGTFRRF